MGHSTNAGILGAQKVLHIKDVGEAAIRKYFLDSARLTCDLMEQITTGNR